jgi:exo-beta-1,3-glucanase (GH17 family)
MKTPWATLCLLLFASCAASSDPPTVARRPLRLPPHTAWSGAGIAYGPYRAGQHPAGVQPTRAQLAEDLRLMAAHWRLLRMYGARGSAQTVAELMHQEHPDLRLMVGAWIEPEDTPAAVEAHQAELQAAIDLATRFPDIVCAISVGNETQVFWSAHNVAADVLIGYLRQARASTGVPITTADDFRFWLTPESQRIADEIDFITLHAYAMWNGQTLDRALAFTQEQYAAVAAQHPGVPLVLGEAGWATCKHTAGDQATLIQGTPGEQEQRVFYEQFRAWTTQERIPSFYFEAFDEPWKGGEHPDDVEKHWGLYRADRTPKAALQ